MVERPAEIIKALDAVPVTVRALTAGVDPEHARHRPEEGEWCIAEVLGHLVDVERYALARVRRIVTEHEPQLESFDHEQLAIDSGYRTIPVAESLTRHAELRAEHVALLRGLDDAAWDRTAVHAELGRMTLFDYLLHVTCEEVDHLAQIARLR